MIENTFEKFQLMEKENFQQIGSWFKVESELFRAFFNIQQLHYKNHHIAYIDPQYKTYNYERIVLQCFLKNIHLLYNCHGLILQGNYGTVNILQRHIFEYLLIGKYLCIIKSEEKAKRWLEKRRFDVYDEIIKPLKKQGKTSLHDYWVLICNQAHATTVSFQITLEHSHIKKETYAALYFILLLLRLNYHLLNSHLISRRLKYWKLNYGYSEIEDEEVRKMADICKNEVFNIFQRPGKKLIKDFESNWKFS